MRIYEVCRGVGDYMLMLCIPLWVWLKKLAERVRLSGLALNKIMENETESTWKLGIHQDLQ